MLGKIGISPYQSFRGVIVVYFPNIRIKILELRLTNLPVLEKKGLTSDPELIDLNRKKYLPLDKNLLR